jgi:FkbM family methyltransferase
VLDRFFNTCGILAMKYSKNLGLKLQHIKFAPLISDFCLQFVFGLNNSCNINPNSNGERNIARKVSSQSDRNSLLVDLGCGIGDFTLLFLKEGFKGDIVSVDANREIIEKFMLNLDSLQKSRIQLFNLAISNREGLVTYWESNDRNMWGVNSLREMRNIGISNPQTPKEVDSMLLENFLNAKGFLDEIKYSGLRMIKLDVEGSELPILQASTQLLQRQFFDVIQIEFGLAARAFKYNFFDLNRLFQEFGYKVYNIKQKRIVEIHDVLMIDNLFPYGNFIAIASRNSKLSEYLLT